ncbi:MAG: protein translocase subunit SecF [spirochete symbiont of Stewartia floridana]|nr:MAG: protein translocase subunit SecF [spirochete symbiont of Stewartia floridana]
MKEYNVLGFRVPAMIISGLIIIAFWAYTLFMAGGFNFGIDFSAGISITADLPSNPSEEDIRSALNDLNPQVQTVGSGGARYNIRIADNGDIEGFQQTISKTVNDGLNNRFDQVSIVNEEYIGVSFAGSLATQTIWVTLIALGLILLYVWVRFKLNYAVSAIVAVFHDVLFLLGFIGALRLEFSTATIAAVLTIIGYSLNDTIVIFDRVRENSRMVKDRSFKDIINLSISQSLSRTLITSITTLLAVLAILVFATGAIRTFALSLSVGVVVGTFSSIFVASPILLVWHDRHARRIKASRTASASVSGMAGTPTGTVSKAATLIPVAQTAEEIARATEKRARIRAKKKRKKK